MINTKLILLEGPPGSGKSTTAFKIAEKISRSGKACRFYYEWSPDHPIDIGDDLHLGEAIASSRSREPERLQLWQKFAKKAASEDAVNVMESRFWQTSVMLMYAAGEPVEGIYQSSQRVVDALKELDPVLILFSIDNLGAFTERIIDLKEAEWKRGKFKGSWAQHIYDALDHQAWFTERKFLGEEGYLTFLEDWSQIADDLYQRLPFPKIKINNPYQNWGLAMQQIDLFLEMDQ